MWCLNKSCRGYVFKRFSDLVLSRPRVVKGRISHNREIRLIPWGSRKPCSHGFCTRMSSNFLTLRFPLWHGDFRKISASRPCIHKFVSIWHTQASSYLLTVSPVTEPTAYRPRSTSAEPMLLFHATPLKTHNRTLLPIRPCPTALHPRFQPRWRARRRSAYI